MTRVREDGVDLDDGTSIVARTVIWGGGESAATIASDAGSAAGRGGRIDVRPDLTVEGYPGVYAVGDVANVPAGVETTAGRAAPAGFGRAAVGDVGGTQHCARTTGGTTKTLPV